MGRNSPAFDRILRGMVPPSQLLLFFLLVFGVVLLPGLDMSFLLATTLAGGRRLGFAGIFGINAAACVHVTVGAAGLVALVAMAPGVFDGLLAAGALYLAWIGLGLIRAGAALPADAAGAAGATARGVAFRRGMITNLLNPKAYAFMLAVFPQFVRADRGAVWLQAVPLWLIIVATQIAVYGGVVLGAGSARRWLLGHPRALVAVGRAVGGFLVLAALASAWEAWRRLP